MSKLRRLTVLQLVCALIIGIGCRQKSSSEKPASLPAKMRFPVARNGEPILVPIVWQGKKLSFLLDTGALYTCFDSSLPLGEPKKQAVSAIRTDRPCCHFTLHPKPSLRL